MESYKKIFHLDEMIKYNIMSMTKYWLSEPDTQYIFDLSRQNKAARILGQYAVICA